MKLAAILILLLSTSVTCRHYHPRLELPNRNSVVIPKSINSSAFIVPDSACQFEAHHNLLRSLNRNSGIVDGESLESGFRYWATGFYTTDAWSEYSQKLQEELKKFNLAVNHSYGSHESYPEIGELKGWIVIDGDKFLLDVDYHSSDDECPYVYYSLSK